MSKNGYFACLNPKNGIEKHFSKNTIDFKTTKGLLFIGETHSYVDKTIDNCSIEDVHFDILPDVILHHYLEPISLEYALKRFNTNLIK